MTALRYEHQLARAAWRWPTRTAVICACRSLTFEELDAKARGLGYALADSGLEPGDSIADLRENSIENLIADFGCAYAGRPRVPINPRLSDEEILGILDDARPRYLMVDEVQARRARMAGMDRLVSRLIDPASFDALVSQGGCGPAQEPDPLLLIQYTSGTTGQPKGSLRTHDAQAWVAANMLMDLLTLRSDDVFVHSQPFNVGTQLFVLPAVMRGATQVIVDRLGAQSTLDAISEHGGTVLKCVPTMLYKILDALGDAAAPPSLRQIIYAAAPMPESVLRRALDRFGPILVQMYGQTENPATQTCLTERDHVEALNGRPALLRSAGRSYSTVDLRIVDQDGWPLPHGEIGEVAVRAPMTSAGYLGRDNGLPRDRAGFARTGDLGYLDADGYLFLSGRAKDTIITGGYNVAPGQVEQTLTEHPAVSQAVVVGLPDEEWGQVVAAAVIAVGEVTSDELIAHCRSRLARYKVPASIRLVSELPVTAAGKLSRQEIVRCWHAS